MEERSHPSSQQSSISIVRGHGEWFVRIVENGMQYTEAYVDEPDAVACAQAFKVRLGVRHIERL